MKIVFFVEKMLLIHDGTGSVQGGTGYFLVVLGQWYVLGATKLVLLGQLQGGSYMMVLGQYKAVLVGIWWHGSVWDGTVGTRWYQISIGR